MAQAITDLIIVHITTTIAVAVGFQLIEIIMDTGFQATELAGNKIIRNKQVNRPSLLSKRLGLFHDLKK
jgi:hypothetical protein